MVNPASQSPQSPNKIKIQTVALMLFQVHSGKKIELNAVTAHIM